MLSERTQHGVFADSRLSSGVAFGSAAPAVPSTGTSPRHPSPPAVIEAPRPLSAWDFLGILLGVALIFAVPVVDAHGRLFWEDEMLGWLLLRDPSWTHMIRAWNLGADGGGFLFYILGRGWFRLFGDAVLTYRLFSATCFGLAFAVLWATLRRFYPTWIVAFACFNTLFFSPPLTMHYMEGRFYGLLVLNVALALWLATRLPDTPAPTPRRWYLLAFLIHAALTTSHVLGVVYSFFLLAAIVVLDRLHRRWRPGLYLCAASSWLLLIPEKTAIVAAGSVGKPHFWTHAPSLGQIIGAFTGSSPEILAVLLLLVLGTTLSLPRHLPQLRASLLGSLRARQSLSLAAGCLLLVPFWFLLEGLVSTWLFADRYLQPVTLGVACLTAELTLLTATGFHLGSLRQRWPRLSALGTLAAASAYTLLLIFWVFHHVAQYTPSVPDFTGPLTARMPRHLPVVVEDAFTFTSLLSREANTTVPYTFLLDWPYALSRQAPRLEVTQFHLMENWKLAGYFPSHIEYSDRFFRDNARFLIVENTILGADPAARPEIGNPIAARLAHTPGYEVHKLFTLDRLYHDNQRDTVLLACRNGCGSDLSLVPAEPEHCEITAHGTTCCQGEGCPLPAPVKPPRFWQITHWFD